MGIFKELNFKSNPFEHYAAETEPHISEYAIRPPYLRSIYDRANALSSFILLGERGSGKSATRLTVYSEIWKSGTRNDAADGPLPVNIVDFTSILPLFTRGHLSDVDFIKVVAFHVVEQTLSWLSSLEEKDRAVYVDGLDAGEKALAIALVESFYLSVPEMDRDRSTTEALKLLNSAWTTKSVIWASRRWDILSKITATVLASGSRRKLDIDSDTTEEVEKLLRSFKTDSAHAPAMILEKLVLFSRSFGFSGVAVLIDKVDETTATSNSAEATAKLVYPILSHSQLLEVDGFSWIFFLWSNVHSHFTSKYKIRLDKIAHSAISWNKAALKEMLEERIAYFSDKKNTLSDIFDSKIDVNKTFNDLCALTSESPRELIKLLDTIAREHDARGETGALNQDSIDAGSDKYAKETANIWYQEKIINQVLRVGKNELSIRMCS